MKTKQGVKVNTGVNTGVNKKVKRVVKPATTRAELLRPKEACAMLGMCKASLYNLSANDPTFPRKIVMTKRMVGFTRESLVAWLAAKGKLI